MVVFPRQLFLGYSQIPDQSETEAHEKAIRPNRSLRTNWLATCSLILVLLATTLGFYTGRVVRADSQCQSPQASYTLKGHVSKTFTYNHTFAGAPSPETSRAWESLYPKGRGFINDPEHRLEAVGVSLFHQLHCLDLLRHTYYIALQPGSLLKPPHDVVSAHTQQHAKHCIDYLRQAIMCAADNTLEPGDTTTRSISGTGVVHQCRDYDEVLTWSEQRRLTAEDVVAWSASDPS